MGAKNENINKDKEIKKLTKSIYSEEKKNISKAVIALSILLAISISANFLLWTKLWNYQRILEFLFINKDGRFEWGGLTSMLAIVSLIGTFIITLNKNKADLISKSRIEWLQETKKLTSEYISSFYSVRRCIKKRSKAKTKEEADEIYTKQVEAFNIMNEKFILLKINFIDNEDHKEIIKCIDDIKKYVNKRYELKNDRTAIAARNLAISSSAYFKREWDKAKKGK